MRDEDPKTCASVGTGVKFWPFFSLCKTQKPSRAWVQGSKICARVGFWAFSVRGPQTLAQASGCYEGRPECKELRGRGPQAPKSYVSIGFGCYEGRPKHPNPTHGKRHLNKLYVAPGPGHPGGATLTADGAPLATPPRQAPEAYASVGFGCLGALLLAILCTFVPPLATPRSLR